MNLIGKIFEMLFSRFITGQLSYCLNKKNESYSAYENLTILNPKLMCGSDVSLVAERYVDSISHLVGC